MKVKWTAAVAAMVAALLLGIPVLAEDTGIKFIDPVVEGVIREQLGIPEGAVTEADMEKVESFVYGSADTADAQITALDDLKHCASLRELSLDGQPITTLEPIRGLALMESITLRQCKVTDLTPLEDMTGIHTVVLDGIPATSLAPVLALPRLTTFIADHIGGLVDLSALTNKENLETFYLRTKLYAPLDPLLTHTNMKSVEFWYMLPSMFTKLAGAFTELDSLYLSHLTDFTGVDLKALAGMKLTDIRLTDCKQIRDVSALAEIPTLQKLNLSGTPVNDLSPLAALKELKALTVSESDQYTLEDLQKLLPGVEIQIEPKK